MIKYCLKKDDRTDGVLQSRIYIRANADIIINIQSKMEHRNL